MTSTFGWPLQIVLKGATIDKNLERRAQQKYGICDKNFQYIKNNDKFGQM